jgi:hypothetical protein
MDNHAKKRTRDYDYGLQRANHRCHVMLPLSGIPGWREQEAFNRSAARRVESIQVSHTALDRIQVHFIVRVTQVVSETANRTPRNIRLVQFGERAEFDCRLRYFEKAHSDGVVRHALLGEHSIESATVRQILTDLRNVATDVLIARGGLGCGRA